MATIGAIPSPPPNWEEEIFPCVDIMSNTITLSYKPIKNSQFVFINGVSMTNHIDYDYTIIEAQITFNSGVLTSDGHVTVKYSHT